MSAVAATQTAPSALQPQMLSSFDRLREAQAAVRTALSLAESLARAKREHFDLDNEPDQDSPDFEDVDVIGDLAAIRDSLRPHVEAMQAADSHRMAAMLQDAQTLADSMIALVMALEPWGVEHSQRLAPVLVRHLSDTKGHAAKVLDSAR
jgi:hypothetical protein